MVHLHLIHLSLFIYLFLKDCTGAMDGVCACAGACEYYYNSKEKKKQWMVSPNIGHFVIKSTLQNVMIVSSLHLPLLSNHFVFEV